ncbi:MAG: hypothetical protein AAGB04_01605 [Pseudomonadota bacterium]
MAASAAADGILPIAALDKASVQRGDWRESPVRSYPIANAEPAFRYSSGPASIAIEHRKILPRLRARANR